MLYSKNSFKKSMLALSIAGSLFSAQTALAYEGGDIIIRAGAVLVDPDDSSSEINLTGIGNSVGTEVGVDSDVQFGISFSYMLDQDFGIELLAATPFGHNIYGKGVLAGVGNLGKTKHLPPTINFNYYPNNASAKFQPYFGLGLNYTTFFDTSASSTLNSDGAIQALATLANVPTGTVAALTGVKNTDIELDDSYGLAMQIGFDYQLTESIGFNAAYWRADIDTEATITTMTDAGPIKATVDVDIDPSVYMVGLSYKF